MLVAGDIGGTKTLLALFSPETGPREPVAKIELHSSDYSGLAPMVRDFFDAIDHTPRYACFAVAGPVIRGQARLTNLPWVLHEKALRRDLGLAHVTLLNDLAAMAVSIPHLQPDELHALNTGQAEPHGPLAVAAPGTGLGEAFLVWNGQKYLACASEGGHADFAPADELQAELLGFMRERFGHVAFEQVCSGSGLPNIYDFLRHTGHATEASEFAAALAAVTDQTPLIVQAAVEDPVANPLAAATIELFVSILGAEAGNLALKILSTGGVYLAGGMPARLVPQLEAGPFMRAFVNKGRFADRLASMPVHVVATRAALLGAAIHGLDQMGAA